MKSSFSNQQAGFTLIETMIAFVVLTMGLLGAVTLQAKAKQASYDAVQRSVALALAQDVVARIQANDTQDLITNYTKTISHNQTIQTPSVACNGNACSSTELALFDVYEIHKALKMRENSGVLANATVCIEPTQAIGAGVDKVLNDFNLKVTISWEGRQDIQNNNLATESSCASGIANRRTVQLNSYILMRA